MPRGQYTCTTARRHTLRHRLPSKLLSNSLQERPPSPHGTVRRRAAPSIERRAAGGLREENCAPMARHVVSTHAQLHGGTSCAIGCPRNSCRTPSKSYYYYSISILWVTTQTQLFLTPPKFFFSCQGSDLSSLGRLMLKKQGEGLMVVNDGVPLFLANFPEGLRCPMPRRPLMVRAALLRRSCDGVAAATESLLRRICADQLIRAHSARRVELMLLRRS